MRNLQSILPFLMLGGAFDPPSDLSTGTRGLLRDPVGSTDDLDQFGADDDDDVFGGDDDDSDDIGDEADDLIEAEDNDDEGIGAVDRQAKISKLIRKLKDKIRAKSQRLRLVEGRAAPGWKLKAKNLRTEIAKLKHRLSKLTDRSKTNAKKVANMGYDSLRVSLDPGGNTPTNVPFLPAAAPGGDWSGAVTRPQVRATIGAGLVTTADLRVRTRSISNLVYDLVNIRVRVTGDSPPGRVQRHQPADGGDRFAVLRRPELHGPLAVGCRDRHAAPLAPR